MHSLKACLYRANNTLGYCSKDFTYVNQFIPHNVCTNVGIFLTIRCEFYASCQFYGMILRNSLDYLLLDSKKEDKTSLTYTSQECYD